MRKLVEMGTTDSGVVVLTYDLAEKEEENR